MIFNKDEELNRKRKFFQQMALVQSDFQIEKTKPELLGFYLTMYKN